LKEVYRNTGSLPLKKKQKKKKDLLSYEVSDVVNSPIYRIIFDVVSKYTDSHNKEDIQGLQLYELSYLLGNVIPDGFRQKHLCEARFEDMKPQSLFTGSREQIRKNIGKKLAILRREKMISLKDHQYYVNEENKVFSFKLFLWWLESLPFDKQI